MWKPILSFTKMRRVRRMRIQQQQSEHHAEAQRRNPYFHRKQPQVRSIVDPLRAWARKDGWAIGGIGILVLITAWYFGLHTQRFVISNVVIEGVQFMNSDDVLAQVNSFLDSRILFVAKRNTFWTLSADSLRSSLDSAYADRNALESIEVVKDFPHTVTVRIIERIPQATWITTRSGQEYVYSVDREGRVAQVFGSTQDVRPEFPIVRDSNRDLLEVGTQVVSEEYMDFLLRMHDQFPKTTGLQIASYHFPVIACQERQYVAEQIFEQEILDSGSDEFREKKRAIQEQFKSGSLTIDQSLAALEKVKQEELIKMGELQNVNSGHTAIQWQAIYVATQCDFPTVAHDLHIITTDESGGFTVYMDSTIDPAVQMQNLQTVLTEKISDRSAVDYIDIRFVDRVYYQ